MSQVPAMPTPITPEQLQQRKAADARRVVRAAATISDIAESTID